MMYKSTEDWIKGRIDPAILRSKRPGVLRAAQSAHAEMRERIFSEGLDQNGELIGSYKPMTVRLRRARGRQTEYVDLRFTGKLSSDFGAGLAKSVVTSQGESAQVIVRGESLKKINDNEARFEKVIFSPSNSEANTFTKAVAFELKEK